MTIKLKDGTVLNVTYHDYDFGPAYDLEEAISESVLSAENLSDVTIDGVQRGFMVLDFFRPDGLQFYLAEPTPEQARMHTLETKVAEQAEVIKELEEQVFPETEITLTVGPRTLSGTVSLCTKDGKVVIPELMYIRAYSYSSTVTFTKNLAHGEYCFKGDKIFLGEGGVIKTFTVDAEVVDAGTFTVYATDEVK